MFITDAQLTTAVHDCLQIKQSSPVAKFWSTLITAANVQAYEVIVNALMKRGWRLDIINQWDRGAEFQRDIALWKVLTQGSAMQPQQYSNTALMALDRRAELEKVSLTINGVWQDPDQIYGQPQTGPGAIRECNDRGWDWGWNGWSGWGNYPWL